MNRPTDQEEERKREGEVYKVVKRNRNKVDMTNLEIEGLNQEIAALQNSGASDTGTQLQIIQYQTEIKSKQVSVQSYQQQIDQAVVSSKVKGIVKAVNETGQDPNGSEAAVVSVTELGEFRIKGKINEQQIAVITAGQIKIINVISYTHNSRHPKTNIR